MTRFTLVACSLWLGFPWSAAAGAVFTTPPVAHPAGGETFCVLQNLDKVDHHVAVRLFNEDGMQTLANDVVVEARSTVTPVGSVAAGVHHFCEFEGLSRKVRGFVRMDDGPNSQRLLLPATK